MAYKARSRQVYSILKNRQSKVSNFKCKKPQPFVNYKTTWDGDEYEFDYFEMYKRKSSDRLKHQELRKLYAVYIRNIRKELHRFWYSKNDFKIEEDVFKITKFSPKILYCFDTKTHTYTLENKKDWRLWVRSAIRIYNMYRPWTAVVHNGKSYFQNISNYYENETWLNKIDDLKSVYSMLLSLHEYEVNEKVVNTIEDLYS